MKKIKSAKLLVFLMVLVLMLSLTVTALAANTNGSITVNNVTPSTVLKVYPILYSETNTGGTYTYTFADPSYKTVFITVLNAHDASFGFTASTSDATIMAAVSSLSTNSTFTENLKTALETAVGSTTPLYTLGSTDYTASVGNPNLGTITKTGINTGYYLIMDGTTYPPGSDATLKSILGTANPNLVANMKSSTHTKPVKEVSEPAKTDGVNIGDVVSYTVTVPLPNFANYSAYTLKVIDTLGKGLTYKEITSVQIMNGATVVATLTSPTGYTFTSVPDALTGKTALTFNFGDVKDSWKDYIGYSLVIKYSATVNADADLVSGTLENGVYAVENDQNIDGNGTKVYTYGFNIKKTNEAGDLLAGVKFEVYAGTTATGSPLTFTKVGDNYIYNPLGTITELVTDANGAIKVFGLKSGSYTLKETYTLPGYNPMADKTFTLGGGSTGTIYTDLDIINYTGKELPSTGGAGTILFTILGCAVIAGGVIFLIVNRRRAVSK